jgi:hypothetical protein
MIGAPARTDSADDERRAARALARLPADPRVVGVVVQVSIDSGLRAVAMAPLVARGAARRRGGSGRPCATPTGRRPPEDDAESRSPRSSRSPTARASDVPSSSAAHPADGEERVNDAESPGHRGGRCAPTSRAPADEHEREPVVGMSVWNAAVAAAVRSSSEGIGTRHYRATSCARISRMTVTLIFPG